MNKNFEQQVDEFIELVKNFDKTSIQRGQYIFNPWTDTDSNDGENAPQIRCSNLKKYMIDNQNADCILIAESPSKGARYTGIAMTSEGAIKNYKLPYEYSSANAKKSPKGESTAFKVWREITQSNKTFVMWNAFAFNIHTKEDKWFENPVDEELHANKYILDAFLKLYPNAQVVAVGATAKKAMDILKIENVEDIRHPSNDFKKQFPEQIAKYL